VCQMPVIQMLPNGADASLSVPTLFPSNATVGIKTEMGKNSSPAVLLNCSAQFVPRLEDRVVEAPQQQISGVRYGAA
jgi:hypothetical protein